MSSFHSRSRISWLGLTFEDTIVDRNLAEGPFSYVFRGTALADPVTCVFKLAKDAGSLDQNLEGNCAFNDTQAAALFTGGYFPVRPDPSFLIEKQYAKLAMGAGPGLISIENFNRFGGMSYMRVEYLEGGNFRQTMFNRGARLKHFIELAGILKRLAANSGFGCHGDLKPENIMHTGKGLTLIDCGYFGELPCLEGDMGQVAVTTPSYYPSLTPDDLFAFGIMLFEAVTGHHPFVFGSGKAGKSPAPSPEFYPLSDELRDVIDSFGAMGFANFEALARIPRISRLRPDLHAKIVELIFACLRMELGADNTLSEQIFFNDFAELEAHMLKLQASGLDFT